MIVFPEGFAFKLLMVCSLFAQAGMVLVRIGGQEYATYEGAWHKDA
jgi:hypothetical protein